MIRSIEVNNFRCYKHLVLKNCARLNVIVGDNGTGKTTLLESLFLPLSGSTEVGVRLRSQRGLDSILAGPPRRIEEGVWGDFFHDQDMSRAIVMRISGDGPEARSLEIARSAGEATLPFGTSGTGSANVAISGTALETVVSAPLTFTWTDSKGHKYSAVPKIARDSFTLPDTGEDLPFFFLFPSNMTVGSAENATRFSELSKRNRTRAFIRSFTQEYDWIKNLDVEVHAGAPTLFATLKNRTQKVPIPNVSGGINRILGVMLGISEAPNGVVLVDEIENGIYYTHQKTIWKTVIALLRDNSCQMFASTHSRECLEALVSAAGSEVKDISLWRTERDDRGTFVVRQFSGKDLKAGVDYGTDVR